MTKEEVSISNDGDQEMVIQPKKSTHRPSCAVLEESDVDIAL
jgi:hypothetical protein